MLNGCSSMQQMQMVTITEMGKKLSSYSFYHKLYLYFIVYFRDIELMGFTQCPPIYTQLITMITNVVRPLI